MDCTQVQSEIRPQLYLPGFLASAVSFKSASVSSIPVYCSSTTRHLAPGAGIRSLFITYPASPTCGFIECVSSGEFISAYASSFAARTEPVASAMKSDLPVHGLAQVFEPLNANGTHRIGLLVCVFQAKYSIGTRTHFFSPGGYV